MLVRDGLFSSESVSDGHPDKICDQISDAVLDACLAQDPGSRVAIETAVKGTTICLLGEITTGAHLDFAAIARDVLKGIGHSDGRWGLDPDTVSIIQMIGRQSREIGEAVDVDTSAGDQGLMFGFACDETPELMPLPIHFAHALMLRQREVRRAAAENLLGPDAKSQITIRYAGGRPVELDTVVLSTQHVPELTLGVLRELVRAEILAPVLGDWLTPKTRILINPAGTFVTGGPAADAGLTGRKIIVDSYGGYARHGGGAFSGKDGTKVDRSGAYAARQLARDVVARGWAPLCEVCVVYAIGVAEPVAVSFETFGTEIGGNPASRYRDEGIDVSALLRPGSIIQRLDLRSPCFFLTAAFGHFGRSGFVWEKSLPATELAAAE